MCALLVSKSCRVKVFSSSFHNALSLALLDHWSPASLLSWSAHLVRCLPMFFLRSLGSHMVSLCVHLLLSILATWPLHFHLSLSARLEASLMPVFLLKSSPRTRSRSVTWGILRSIFRWHTWIICFSLCDSDRV